MAHDRLTVDVDGLRALQRTLDAIRHTLNVGRNELDRVRGEMGSGDVEGALDDFHGNWQDGRAKIDDNATKVSAMTASIIQNIGKTDRDLGHQLATSMQGGPKVVRHDASVDLHHRAQ